MSLKLGGTSTRSTMRYDHQAKQITYNVYSYFKKRKITDKDSEEYIYDVNLANKVSEVTGISKGAVTKIIREGNNMKLEDGIADFKPKDPTRKTPKKRLSYDDFTESLVRKKIVTYYMNTTPNEHPSIRTLNTILKEENVLQCSSEYLRNMLFDLGFTLGPFKERDEIVSERTSYLKSIKEFRAQNRPIFYHCETKRWVTEHDPTAAPKDLPRVVILHESGSPGFQDKTQIMLKMAPISENYDECFEKYEYCDWIRDTVLPNLPPNSVIVTNIPYCETLESMRLDKKPTTDSPRDSILSWLNRHNITIKETESDADLLGLINIQSSNEEPSVSKIIKDSGHDLLHLPQRHSDLNVVAVMWRDLKEDALDSDAKELFRNYPKEKLKRCSEFAKESEELYFAYGTKMNYFPPTVKQEPVEIEVEVNMDLSNKQLF